MTRATNKPWIGPWWVRGRQPVLSALLLAAAPAILSVVIGLVGERLGGDPLVWRLAAVLVIMVGALLVVARARARAVPAAPVRAAGGEKDYWPSRLWSH